MRWLLLLTLLPLALVQAPGQTPTVPLLWANPQFFDCSGGGGNAPCKPLAGGSVYTYVAGTNTPLATCASPAMTGATCTSANSNPIALNTSGYNAAGSGNAGIWMLPRCYKFVLKDSSGSTVWTQDQVCNQSGFIPAGGQVPVTIPAALNSAFVYDIGFDTAAHACASSITVAVTKQSLWTGLSTMSCPAPLWFPTGAGVAIQPASGQTVTFTGVQTVAPGTQAYDLSAGGIIHLAHGSVASITPQNFGAKEDGSTDDVALIQGAMDSICYSSECSASILFLGGTYYTGAQLNGYNGTTPYNGLNIGCATQGYSSCTINYNGSSSASAIRTIGKFDKISGINISLVSSGGWQAALSYDGDPSIGISTDMRLSDIFITCNFNPGDGLWGGQNNYQADQLLADNLDVTECVSGSAIRIWTSNALSYTFVKPNISHNQYGLQTSNGTNVAVFGGDFDANDVNFYPGVGTTLLVSGTRSESSKRQLWSGGPSGAGQVLTYQGNYIASYTYTRPATTGAGMSGQAVITLSTPGFAIGDNIVCGGCGPAAADLQTPIIGMSGLTTATLGENLSTTVTVAPITLDATTQQDQFVCIAGGPYNFTGNFFQGADSTHNVTFESEQAYAFQSFNFTGNTWSGDVPNPFLARSNPKVLSLTGNVYDVNSNFGGPFAMSPASSYSPATLSAGATTLNLSTGSYFFTANTSGSPGVITTVSGKCNNGQSVVVVPQDIYTSFVNSGNILLPQNVNAVAATEYQAYLLSCFIAGNPGAWALITPVPVAASFTYAQLNAAVPSPSLGSGPYTITDSTTNTWGAVVTVGGGSDAVQVWYNGTKWTVVGK